jgi:hypothetical protein
MKNECIVMKCIRDKFIGDPGRIFLILILGTDKSVGDPGRLFFQVQYGIPSPSVTLAGASFWEMTKFIGDPGRKIFVFVFENWQVYW